MDYLINHKEEIITPGGFEIIYNASENLYAVSNKNKWGYIDCEGKEKIQLQYDEVWPFSDGLAYVKKEGLSAFIDHNNELMIHFQNE